MGRVRANIKYPQMHISMKDRAPVGETDTGRISEAYVTKETMIASTKEKCCICEQVMKEGTCLNSECNREQFFKEAQGIIGDPKEIKWPAGDLKLVEDEV